MTADRAQELAAAIRVDHQSCKTCKAGPLLMAVLELLEIQYNNASKKKSETQA